jgi:bla regulator protein BlaR1
MTVYLINVILSSGLFIALYLIMLQKVKIYRFNRWYLILTLVISFIIPLIEIEIPNKFSPNQLNYSTPINETVEQVKSGFEYSIPETKENQISLKTYIVYCIYILVTSLLFIRFVKNIKSLQKLIKSSDLIVKNGYKIILVQDICTPFSFLNSIFLDKEMFENIQIETEILDHELAHVNQGHSYDILFLEFLSTFFWFNPFLPFYKRSIKLNHEFLADDEVLNKYNNIIQYQNLLIYKIGLQINNVFTSNFNYSFTKKRLQMMNKQTKFWNAVLAKFSTFPIIFIIIALFGQIGQSQVQIADKQLTGETIHGATDAEIAEYQEILKKYIFKTKKGAKGINNPSEKDRARLEVIFLTMSKEQQAKQEFIMVPPMKPFDKKSPSKMEFDSYKNSAMYGVWLDGKKIKNSVLNNYQSSDISHVFVSKLYGNAQKTIGYKYKYQVDMMTQSHYEAYRKTTLADKKYFLIPASFYSKK